MLSEQFSFEKRVALCRLAVWMLALLITWVLFREEYPPAWQVAAFGAIFTLLWPLARRGRPGPNAPSDAAPTSSGEQKASSASAASGEAFAHAIDIGVDLVVITVLVNVSGGFNSPFSPLYFVAVVEAYALLGAPQAIYASLAAAILSLVHLRLLPITAHAAVLYGMAMGTLLVSAILVGLRQGSAGLTRSPDEEGGLRLGRRSTLVKQRATEALEKQLEDEEAAHNQLKSTYREVARLHREQKTQIDRLRAAEQIFEASTISSEGDAAYARLLRVVMDALEAGGSVLWLRDRRNDTLTVQAMEGRIAPLARAEPVPRVSDTSPGDLRALCESRLFAAAPVVPAPPVPAPRPEVAGEDGEPTGATLRPTGGGGRPGMVILLREAATDSASISPILGALGLCDPRGAARFSQEDAERFQTFAVPFAAALSHVQQQQGLQRRVREISLLFDLSRLVQTATDMNQIYNAVVAQVQQVIPYENCTLFLLDKAHSRLEAKATRGRVVNLLDHIPFEKGGGVSGWVASRGRQIVIADLTQEPNLLNVEMIPPRIRSFVAVPLRVQDNVVGVLNLSHSQANAFSAEDVQLLTILAGQAAITIERTEVFHTLEQLAITDGLTQVYNHRFFQMRLEEELRRGRRYNLVSSLMMVDADGFKAINDQYGHTTGDLALRELATILRRSVRETEVVARYGGEEFALILPQTGAEQALIAAERVRANIETHPFSTANGEPMRLTVSIGVATYPQHAQTRDRWIQQADQALYAAKQGGRNRICIATPLQG